MRPPRREVGADQPLTELSNERENYAYICNKQGVDIPKSKVMNPVCFILS